MRESFVQVKFYTREGNWDLVGNNFPVSKASALCLHWQYAK